MNAITQALQTAGVKLPPLNKRIWLWLHDHPGKTSREVAVALGISHANAASTLAIMAKRKMVTAQAEQNFRNQSVLRYETCIKRFELLPLPKKSAKGQPLAFSPTAVVEPAAPTRTPLEAIPAPLLKTLEQYKLSELRLIRDGLNFLFGGVK